MKRITKRLLITATLLNSMDWYKTCPESWKEKALQDLKNTLQRKEYVPSKAAERGQIFEEHVFKAALSNKTGSPFFNKVVQSVKGCLFQQWYEKYFLWDQDYTIKMYGKFDAIQKTEKKIIRDIKTMEKYSFPKYQLNNQHRLYCDIAGYKEFEYIIVVWDKYPKIKTVEIEHYFIENQEENFSYIKNKIKEFFTFLQKINLWKDYYTLYCKL